MRAMSSAQMPAGVMPYGVPRVDQRVPHGDGALGGNPDLVAEVAGVAGARDRDGNVARAWSWTSRKYLSAARSLCDACSRMPRDNGPWSASAPIFADTSSICTSMPDGVQPQPARCSARRSSGGTCRRRGGRSCRRRSPCRARRTTACRAPGRRRTWSTSRVTMRSSSRAASRPVIEVLVERRDVEQRRRVADRGVLAIRVGLVRRRDLMPRPATPGLRPYQRGRARVKWSL